MATVVGTGLCDVKAHSALLNQLGEFRRQVAKNRTPELSRLVEIYTEMARLFTIDEQVIYTIQLFKNIPETHFGRQLTKCELEQILAIDTSKAQQNSSQEKLGGTVPLERALQNENFKALMDRHIVQLFIEFGERQDTTKGSLACRYELATMSLEAHEEECQKTTQLESGLDESNPLKAACQRELNARQHLIAAMRANDELIAKLPIVIQNQIRQLQLQIAKGEKLLLATVPDWTAKV